MRKFIGVILALMIDFSSGLLSTHLLGFIYKISLEWWIYLIGVGFAFSPDIDTLITKLLGKKIDSTHRNRVHHPLIFMIIGIVWLLFVRDRITFWPILFLVASMLHFIHDSIGDANWPGIKWGSPLIDHHYSFRTTLEGTGKGLVKFLRRFKHQEVSQFERVGWGLNHWLADFYLRPTKEMAFGLVYLIVVLFIILLIKK